jgi:hypothetical protein
VDASGLRRKALSSPLGGGESRQDSPVRREQPQMFDVDIIETGAGADTIDVRGLTSAKDRASLTVLPYAGATS